VRPRLYLCDGCKKLSEPIGTTCKDCAKDYSEVMVYYNKLLQLRPELKSMTLPQVILQLAKAYLSR